MKLSRMAQACDRAGFRHILAGGGLSVVAQAFDGGAVFHCHTAGSPRGKQDASESAGESFRRTRGIRCRSPWKRASCRRRPEKTFLLGLGASKIFMKEIGEGEKGKEVRAGDGDAREHRDHRGRC